MTESTINIIENEEPDSFTDNLLVLVDRIESATRGFNEANISDSESKEVAMDDGLTKIVLIHRPLSLDGSGSEVLIQQITTREGEPPQIAVLRWDKAYSKTVTLTVVDPRASAKHRRSDLDHINDSDADRALAQSVINNANIALEKIRTANE